MPSFDIVSKIDQHEVTNAVDQTNREVSTRFDFKDSNAHVELTKEMMTLVAPSDFQLKQMDEILRNRLTKRGIDMRTLTYKEITSSLHEAKQEVTIKQGIAADDAKKITKLIKESGLKVQASIQGDQVRVTGKKRDDLQEAIALLKSSDLPLPLQYINFRD